MFYETGKRNLASDRNRGGLLAAWMLARPSFTFHTHIPPLPFSSTHAQRDPRLLRQLPA